MSIVRRWVVFLVICSSFSFAGAQQEPIKLWPKGAPGSEGNVTPETVRLNPDGEHIISNIQEPSILPYLPCKDMATGAAVIVAPGGVTANYGWITKVMPWPNGSAAMALRPLS